MRELILLLVALMLGIAPGLAQDADPTPDLPPTPEAVYFEPQVVEAEAADGLTLVGDWFVVAPSRPTILLLHQLYTDRSSWRPLIGLLLGADYNVLSVDVRGAGQTRGAIDWPQAVEDVGVWMNWLQSEGGVSGPVMTIGSSMGSSLALLGCQQTPICRGAVAISPGWAYYGLEIEPALSGDRPALLLFADQDRWPALARPRIEALENPAVALLTVPGNAHGMDLLRAEHRVLVPPLLDWLAQHGG